MRAEGRKERALGVICETQRPGPADNRRHLDGSRAFVSGKRMRLEVRPSRTWREAVGGSGARGILRCRPADEAKGPPA